MFDMNLRPALAVLVSLAASGLIYVLGDHIHRNVREAITFLAAAAKIVLVYSMIPAVLAGEAIELTVLPIVKGVDLAFSVDPAGMVFACVASTLWILTSCYSVGYMRGHGKRIRPVTIRRSRCACPRRPGSASRPTC